MYSELLIAAVLPLVDGSHSTGARLDRTLGRWVLSVGRIVGPMIGAHPNDASAIWHARTYGKPAPVGSRGALHVLADGRTALHLGGARGAVESAGNRLVIVREPEAGRYVTAWWMPRTSYGGLI